MIEREFMKVTGFPTKIDELVNLPIYYRVINPTITIDIDKGGF